jgi:hypothetical protein
MTWGSWQLDRERLVLDLHDDAGHWLYEIDLERCATAAAVLDWIMQVAGKAWTTDAITGALVRALDDLLDPQTRLCRMAMNGERGEDVAELVRANEIDSRAWRVAWERTAAINGEHGRPVGLANAAELFATHDRACREISADLDAESGS